MSPQFATEKKPEIKFYSLPTEFTITFLVWYYHPQTLKNRIIDKKKKKKKKRNPDEEIENKEEWWRKGKFTRRQCSHRTQHLNTWKAEKQRKRLPVLISKPNSRSSPKPLVIHPYEIIFVTVTPSINTITNNSQRHIEFSAA